MTDWPLPLRHVLIFTLQAGLMTYVILPRLTPRIARCIDPNSSTV